jgi:pyrroline-5-carboxylate reductase
MNITIIGGGNLGRAMAEGLLKSGQFSPESLWVTRQNVSLIADLGERGANIGSDNIAAAARADVLILALKPQKIKAVLRQMADYIPQNCLLVSVATGVNIAELAACCGEISRPVFRAMPNTAIAIQESMTCIAANAAATAAQRQQIESIFSLMGSAIFIDESLMDAATVLGACGIAYALRYIRASTQAGIQIGFSAATAQHIAAQTVQGAAALLLQLGQHPETEIDKVTTPQGCTIVGLNEMEFQGFSAAIIKGVMASHKKIEDIKG